MGYQEIISTPVNSIICIWFLCNFLSMGQGKREILFELFDNVVTLESN